MTIDFCPPWSVSPQTSGRSRRRVVALEDLNAYADSLEPWYDSPHGEEPGSIADPSLDREYRRIKRAVPRGDTALLNSSGGVKAALKRAVELQLAPEGRSFQVVIDGDRTGQSQRRMEARFGSA